LAVDALASDLDLNHRDKLLTGVVEPAGMLALGGGGVGRDARQSNLQVCSVSKVTITRNGALNTATEVSLSVESLFDSFHGKVGVATVSYLPKGNLRVARKINILGTVGDKLH